VLEATPATSSAKPIPRARESRIQREGDVVHVVAYKLIDLSAELASVGGREAPFPLPHGRGDEFHRGPPAPDPRTPSISLKTRNFR